MDVIDSRRRNLWPLPGGVGAYSASIETMLNAARSGPGRREYEERVGKLFRQVTSQSTVRGYTGVLVTLGLLDSPPGQPVSLTKSGERLLATGDLAVLRRALVSRVFGVSEVLEVLTSGPVSYPELVRHLERSGVTWGNQMAIRYRVWWLRAAEAIEADRQMRMDVLRLTAAGRRLINRASPRESTSVRPVTGRK